jgi:hypothetical protein
MSKIRRSKYGNVKTNGFDSKREYMRYRDLLLMEKAGMISHLQTQVRFEIVPKTDRFRGVHYIADFVYLDKNGDRVVEDSKGKKTALFIVKQKLMYHVLGIEVICV